MDMVSQIKDMNSPFYWLHRMFLASTLPETLLWPPANTFPISVSHLHPTGGVNERSWLLCGWGRSLGLHLCRQPQLFPRRCRRRMRHRSAWLDLTPNGPFFPTEVMNSWSVMQRCADVDRSTQISPSSVVLSLTGSVWLTTVSPPNMEDFSH